MKKTAYLAIDYICNEHCRFCPCSQADRESGAVTPLPVLQESIRAFSGEGVRQLVLSGGEPTLHPQLPEIVRGAQDAGLEVVVLSNSERFSDGEFLDRFLTAVRIPALTVITTLHSGQKEEHEAANETPGSFDRTLRGLEQLCRAGVPLIVKHCITLHNAGDLTEFYHFVDGRFPERVSIQLCGIDYCGIPREQLTAQRLTFPQLKPHLEEMLEEHLARRRAGSRRNLYAIHLPLCSCDPYYWSFLRRPPEAYASYQDPLRPRRTGLDPNAGPFGNACGGCRVRSLCGGTYRSAFQAFGDAIVRSY